MEKFIFPVEIAPEMEYNIFQSDFAASGRASAEIGEMIRKAVNL